MYRNGVDEHEGQTEFLDLGATRDFARSGYLFGRVADRRADLARDPKWHRDAMDVARAFGFSDL